MTGEVYRNNITVCLLNITYKLVIHGVMYEVHAEALKKAEVLDKWTLAHHVAAVLRQLRRD